jgi:hypothetical protein
VECKKSGSHSNRESNGGYKELGKAGREAGDQWTLGYNRKEEHVVTGATLSMDKVVFIDNNNILSIS